MDAAYSLCVLSVCALLLCLRVIVLDKRTCGQGWKGGCPIPASLCLLLNNEVNNADPSPPLLLILVLALALRVLSWEAPGDSHHTSSDPAIQ